MNQITVVIVVVLGIITLWVAWGLYTSGTAENTPYTLDRELPNGVEIRQYGKQTLISTTSMNENSAFSPLGNYIFGNNQRQEKITMTAPVITKEKGNSMEMSFILPEGYTKDTAPAPNSERVLISEIGERKVATIQFSGYATNSVVGEKQKILQETLQNAGMKMVGEMMLWQYNDPWTAPFMRTNEVAVEIQ